jgi:nucleoid-associated protein YgaU
VDVTHGEFYTNEEIKGLSQEGRDRYCESLSAEIERLRAETNALLAAADSVGQVSDSLKMVNSELTTQIRDLDGEVRQLRLARRSSTTYIVKAGDTLQKIASVVYGKSSRWNDIYLANKDRIGAPNAPLKVGTQLKIPAK